MTTQQGLDAGARQELVASERKLSGFMGAARVAAFNACTLGFFATLSLVSGLSSLPNLIVGVALAVVAANEFRGRTALLRFEPSGLQLLWRNQLGFLLFMVAYCLWGMFAALRGADPELVALVGSFADGADELVQEMMVSTYQALLLVVILFQGLSARYYHRRVARLEQYLGETPEWVVEFQRARQGS